MSKPSSRRSASRSAWLAIPLWSMTATGSPEMCSIADTTTVTPARAMREKRIRRWRYAFTRAVRLPGPGGAAVRRPPAAPPAIRRRRREPGGLLERDLLERHQLVGARLPVHLVAGPVDVLLVPEPDPGHLLVVDVASRSPGTALRPLGLVQRLGGRLDELRRPLVGAVGERRPRLDGAPGSRRSGSCRAARTRRSSCPAPSPSTSWRSRRRSPCPPAWP